MKEKNTRHTPGPWIVGVSADDKGWPAFRLAAMNDLNPDSEEVQADIDLIAAAPDLYDACKLIADTMPTPAQIDMFRGAPGMEVAPELETAFRAVAAAIAKAEGRR